MRFCCSKGVILNGLLGKLYCRRFAMQDRIGQRHDAIASTCYKICDSSGFLSGKYGRSKRTTSVVVDVECAEGDGDLHHLFVRHESFKFLLGLIAMEPIRKCDDDGSGTGVFGRW